MNSGSATRNMIGRFDRWLENLWLLRWIEICKARLAPLPDPMVRLERMDIGWAALLAALAAICALAAMRQIPDFLYSAESFNIWFQADQPRSIMAMSDRMSKWHERDNVHPLYSIAIFPIIQIIGLFGFNVLASCKIFIVIVSFFTEFFLFLTMRHMAVDRFRAVLGGLAFLSSATFIHWFGLVETFAPSGLTVVLCTYLFVRRSPPSAFAMVAASVISISMVITNWTLGLSLTASKLKFGKFVRYSALALATCLCLSVAQKQIFPKSGYFFSPKTLAYEQKYISVEEDSENNGNIVIERLQSLFLSSAVAPFPENSIEKFGEKEILTNQRVGFIKYKFIGIIALLSWVSLLFIAIFGIILEKKINTVFLGLSLFLISQMILHSVYGEITFLYIADYFPALLILVCVSGALRWPRLHNALLVTFILSGAVANGEAFLSATHMAGELAEMRMHSASIQP